MSALMELLKKKKQAMSAGRRAKTAKIPDGPSRWRILPSWRKDDETFFHDFGQHFIKDAAGDIKAVVVCVDKTYNKPCSICSAVATAIKNSVDDDTTKLLKEAQASGRILMNALHISGENPTEPVILEVAPTVFESIMNMVLEWGDEFLSIESGKEIIIERNGKGKLTKYSVQVAAKANKVDPEVMKKIANLDEYVAQENEEAANRALNNLAAISGLLPAPAASAPRAALSSPASHAVSMRDVEIDDVVPVDDDDEALRELEESLAPATAAESAKPAVAETAAPKAASKPATATKTPVVEDGIGDLDLDNLLTKLGGKLD